MRLIATPAGIVPASHLPAAEPERRGWLKRLGALLGGTLLAGNAVGGTRGTASVQGMDPYIGEIAIFGFNYAPQGWAQCNGQLLQIAQYNALYALIGTYYGGNGVNNFALPNLQGRFPMHQGNGQGLSPHPIGQAAGTETVTLISSQMPMHNHTTAGTAATTSPGNTNNPNGALLANDGAGGAQYATGASADAIMAGSTTSVAGGSQPHDNMPPYLALNFCIALEGIWPSRQ